MDKRRQKINELKAAIKTASEELTEASEEFKALKNKTYTEEEKTELLSKLSIKRAILEELDNELKLIRMNKNSSSAFEWIPSPPNRRMRRAAFKHIK